MKHEANREWEGSKVIVRAIKRDDDCAIEAIDDGGASTSPTSPQQITGTENAREQLAALCGGALDIENTPESGTTAAMHITKEQRCHDAHTRHRR